MSAPIAVGGSDKSSPSSASTSAAPEALDSARLPCLAILAPARASDESGGGRDIESARAVAAGADNVAKRFGGDGGGDGNGARAHDLGGGGDFDRGFAFGFEGD